MANKMYIPDDNKQNSLFCRLKLVIHEKVPKVVKPTNKKTLLKK